MKKRSTFNPYKSAVNIYEVHVGSWRRHEDGSLLFLPGICRAAHSLCGGNGLYAH